MLLMLQLAEVPYWWWIISLGCIEVTLCFQHLELSLKLELDKMNIFIVVSGYLFVCKFSDLTSLKTMAVLLWFVPYFRYMRIWILLKVTICHESWQMKSLSWFHSPFSVFHLPGSGAQSKAIIRRLISFML